MPILKINYIPKILTNKTVLKGLEKVSDNTTSFTALTSLFMSTVVRPMSIKSTPDVEKENKQYAMTNSISSGLVKFGVIESVALPVEYSIKKINENPEKFLSKNSIEVFQKGGQELAKSRSYKLLTQGIKLSTGFLTAVPKSVITVALIPILMDKLFNKKVPNKKTFDKNSYNPQKNEVSFTGLTKGLAKIIDNKSLQKLAIKYQNKDKDIAFHSTVLTDLLLTATSVCQIHTNDKIKDNRKRALIYNNIISTGITLAGGGLLNNFIKNKSAKTIELFKTLNKNDAKLLKYIEGINILRPAVIFAGIYYGILPMFSTYIAEKVDKFVKHRYG